MDDLFLDNAAAESAQAADNPPAESTQPETDSGAEGMRPEAGSRTEGGLTRRERARVRDPRPSLFAANAFYLLAAAGLVLMQPLSEPLTLMIMYLFPTLSVEAILLAVNSLYYVGCLMLPVAAYAASHGTWKSMRLSKLPKWKHVWRALLAAAVAVPLIPSLSSLWYMVLQSFGLTIVAESFHVPSTGTGLVLMVLCIGVLPGVCEELVFRGMVLGAWERRGTLWAMLISSLMFASLHGSVSGFPAHFLLGCAIAVITVGSGSIYTGMIFHGVYNSLLLLLQFFFQNFLPTTEEDLAAVELMQTDAAAALGGAYAVAVTVIEAILLGIAIYFILRGIWPRKEKIDLSYGEADWERPDERAYDWDDEPGVELVPRTRGQMEWPEFLVLFSGVVTVIFMYGQDFLNMLGGGA